MKLLRKQKPTADDGRVKSGPYKGAYEFQVDNIKAHVQAFQAGQIGRAEGSDMGAGKTYIVCFVAKLLERPLFVACPKTSLKNWRDAAKQVGARLIHCVNYEALTVGSKHKQWGTFPVRDKANAEYEKALLEYAKEIAKYDAKHPGRVADLQKAAIDAMKLQPEEAKALVKAVQHKYRDAPLCPHKPIIEDNTFEWDLPDDIILAFDEVHRCNGLTSLNSELVIAARRQEVQHIVVSASLACDPTNMKATGYSLDLHSLDDFENWALTNGCYRTKWNSMQFISCEETLMELHTQIYPDKGARIRIADLGDRFPETQISADSYDMGSNLKKMQKAEDEMKTELAKWEAGFSGALNPLVIMLRFRQKCELLKVPLFVEMAEDALADGMRVLIFLSFRESILAAQRLLKTNCLYYGGNKSEREKWLAKFQANEKDAKCMILNIAAGAESINCHDLDGRYPRYSLISPTWSATKMSQCLGRPHRAGGKSRSIQRIVYSAGTVEEKVCSRVREKLNNMAVLNDYDLVPDHLQGFLRPLEALLKEFENTEQ